MISSNNNNSYQLQSTAGQPWAGGSYMAPSSCLRRLHAVAACSQDAGVRQGQWLARHPTDTTWQSYSFSLPCPPLSDILTFSDTLRVKCKEKTNQEQLSLTPFDSLQSRLTQNWVSVALDYFPCLKCSLFTQGHDFLPVIQVRARTAPFYKASSSKASAPTRTKHGNWHITGARRGQDT